MREKSRSLQKWLLQVQDVIISATLGAIENTDYSNLYILNQYAGVKFGTPILGRLQHGWSPDELSTMYYQNNYVQSFVWSQKAEECARGKGWRNVYAIGAPWLYLTAILEKDGWNSCPEESIELRSLEEIWVYGFHSTKRVESVDTELVEFIELAIKSKATRKQVLLSESDFRCIQSYSSELLNQIDIVTLGKRRGNISSNSHLFRLYHLLSNTQTIVTDHPTTLLLYGITLGCRLRWIYNSSFDKGHEFALKNNDLELKDFMSDSLNDVELKKFAYDCLGQSSFKTPDEIRNLFSWHSDGMLFSQKISTIFKNTIALIPRYVRSKVGN